jgi:undecaprenyl diphosphate synthase
MDINHLGIIPDGNGRYGIKTSGSRHKGHQKGIEKIKEIIDQTLLLKIPLLSIYILSKDNVLKRDKKEINQLLEYFNSFIAKYLPDFTNRQIKLVFWGNKDYLDETTLKTIKKLDQQIIANPTLTIYLLLGYSSVERIQKIAGETDISSYFLPPLDLVIRTGGHHRLSDFLLYESSYAELYFLDCLWPEITTTEFSDIITSYQQQTKKYGAVV